MEMAELLRLLAIANYRLYTGTLIGNPPPFTVEVREALTHPVPGDLVMEITTIHLPREDVDRFGRLIMVREEILRYADNEEANLNDHEVRRETFTYIERADGALRRWSNCDFIRVLERLSRDRDDAQERRETWVRDAKQRHGLADDPNANKE